MSMGTNTWGCGSGFGVAVCFLSSQRAFATTSLGNKLGRGSALTTNFGPSLQKIGTRMRLRF